MFEVSARSTGQKVSEKGRGGARSFEERYWFGETPQQFSSDLRDPELLNSIQVPDLAESWEDIFSDTEMVSGHGIETWDDYFDGVFGAGCEEIEEVPKK